MIFFERTKEICAILCNIVQSHTLYTHCTPCIMTNGFVYFLMFEEKKNDDGVCDNPEESQ